MFSSPQRGLRRELSRTERIKLALSEANVVRGHKLVSPHLVSPLKGEKDYCADLCN
jgi:hypothetical protein